MPGTIGAGRAENANLRRTAEPKEAQTFCLGRDANAAGALKDTNPWDNSTAGSHEAELEKAWDDGFDDYTNNPTEPRGCLN